jgi:hypothetical protein
MPKKGPDATALRRSADARIRRYHQCRDQESKTTTGYPGLLGELPIIYPPFFMRRPHSVAMQTVWRQLDNCSNEEFSRKLHEYDSSLFISMKRERPFAYQLLMRSRTKTSEGSEGFDEAHIKKLLYQHYGIDTAAADADAKLLRALMEAHVPAFQVTRALDEHYAKRSRKPPKLDWKGSAYLFIHEHLKDESKKRLLSSLEEELKKRVEQRLKAYDLAERTIRDLRAQMDSAYAKYFEGRATDFQKQFVELAVPWLDEYFRRIERRSRVVRKAQKP